MESKRGAYIKQFTVYVYEMYTNHPERYSRLICNHLLLRQNDVWAVDCTCLQEMND